MAYTKILVVHDRLDKSVGYAQNGEKTSLKAALDYALNRDKTEQTCFETAVNCDRASVYADMTATKRRWAKTGRKRKGYHIIQSFAPGEVTPEEAHAVGVELTQELLGDRYEAIVATHLDKAHLHNHIIFNSVSFVDGAMYRDTMKDYYQGIRGTSDDICRRHGLSVIEPDPDNPDRRRSRRAWEGKATIRTTIKWDVDAAIAKAYTFKSFLQVLRDMGYQVSGETRRHIAIRPPGGKGNIRLDSLGEGYTEADIKARLDTVRRGETSPAQNDQQPAPSTPYRPLSPGSRFRLKSGLPRHRPQKLTGFQALCFKYLYLLRDIKRGRPAVRTAFSMREELIKFDRYQRQFLYLHRNRIETTAQLSMQQDAIQASMDVLIDRRREFYKRRRAGDDTAAEIEAITRQLRSMRRDLKLCEQIETDAPKMRTALDEAAKQRSNPRERPRKTKNARQEEVK